MSLLRRSKSSRKCVSPAHYQPFISPRGARYYLSLGEGSVDEGLREHALVLDREVRQTADIDWAAAPARASGKLISSLRQSVLVWCCENEARYTSKNPKKSAQASALSARKRRYRHDSGCNELGCPSPIRVPFGVSARSEVVLDAPRVTRPQALQTQSSSDAVLGIIYADSNIIKNCLE
ncbi:hypothetical protein BOTBODRAFT_449450 [Botryobasidium botryosum FD-172 SS1]|uniref:Uncharacterized protein n=1 Tax=Botryobasidium botryosum (strain FD-172 SS1) TaxID=930990 RepID=A0A067MAH0_BOTB1|nr:hypothetical protein BOTBODRAFT_449450 [Botryobasidium botryosum FD-172 SS1]